MTSDVPNVLVLMAGNRHRVGLFSVYVVEFDDNSSEFAPIFDSDDYRLEALLERSRVLTSGMSCPNHRAPDHSEARWFGIARPDPRQSLDRSVPHYSKSNGARP